VNSGNRFEVGLHLDTCIRTCMRYMSIDKSWDISPYKWSYILYNMHLALKFLDTFCFWYVYIWVHV
jgi:hypothetical protein